MNGVIVNEEELRARWEKVGKNAEEIEQLIDEYIEASGSGFLNTDAISEIVKKTQKDRALRVKGFNLTREQFDVLTSYYEEIGGLVPGQPVDANLLVQKALREFIDLLSE
jgi:uncharacterized protein (UPF0335 family)